jgi:hypothetical protein
VVIAGQPQRAAGRRPPAAWLNRGVIIPGGAKRNLSAEKAAALLRAVQPVTAVEGRGRGLAPSGEVFDGRPGGLGGEGGEPVGAGVGQVAADEDEFDPGRVGLAHRL